MVREGSHHPRENPQKLTYDEISWEPNSPLRDTNLWERNKLIVKELVERDDVEIVEIRERSSGCGKDVPTKYKIDGLVIDYQPNWNFYQINLERNGTAFFLPKDAEVSPKRCVEVLLNDIGHMKQRATKLN
jgi:hypothetical protein